MFRLLVAATLIWAVLTGFAAAMTVQEARTLPIRELARRALGDSGALVVAADRPLRPDQYDKSLPPPPPDGVAGFTLGLYLRPSSASLSDTSGLCATEHFDLIYEPSGIVRSVGSTTLYFFVSELKERDAKRDMKSWRVEAAQECGSVEAVPHFFRADSYAIAVLGGAALSSFRKSSESNKTNIPIECKSYWPGPFAVTLPGYDALTNVSAHDCESGHSIRDIDLLRKHYCFAYSFDNGATSVISLGLNVSDDGYGHLTIQSASFYSGTKVY